MDKELLAQLNNLKILKPSSSWVREQRVHLLSHITTIDGEVKQVQVAPRLQEGFGLLVRHFMLAKPVLAVFGIVLVALGSTFTVSASSSSIPGNILYQVKMAKEKVELAVRPMISNITAGEIHMEHAANRLAELKTINATALTNTPQYEEQAKIVVDKMKEEINSANESVVQLAGIVADSESIKIIDKLETQATNLKNDIVTEAPSMPASVKNDVQEVVKATQVVSDKALDVLATKQTDPLVQDAVDASKLAEKINKRIEDLNKSLVVIAGVDSNNDASPEKKEPIDITSIKAKDLFDSKITADLTEAKKLLTDGKLNEALAKVKEADSFTQSGLAEGDVDGEIKGGITPVAASTSTGAKIIPYVRKVEKPIVVENKMPTVQSTIGETIKEDSIMIPEMVMPVSGDKSAGE